MLTPSDVLDRLAEGIHLLLPLASRPDAPREVARASEVLCELHRELGEQEIDAARLLGERHRRGRHARELTGQLRLALHFRKAPLSRDQHTRHSAGDQERPAAGPSGQVP